MEIARSRHLGKAREPPFIDLLSAAGLVELHDDVRLTAVEIRGGIVEREMPVLADPDKCDIDRCLADRAFPLLRTLSWGSRSPLSR